MQIEVLGFDDSDLCFGCRMSSELSQNESSTCHASSFFRTPCWFKLDPVSRVTGIPGWYWILGIKCSETTGVGPISKNKHAMHARVTFL